MIASLNSLKRAALGSLGALVLATTCLAAATVPATAVTIARVAGA